MPSTVNNPIPFAMRTWRFSGTRFFASLLLKNHGISCQNCRYNIGTSCPNCGMNRSNNTFWNIWVTAACGKLEASKFRSEIRLASNIQPECTVVSHRPILHFESDILSTSDLSTYPACLEVSWRTVTSYITDKNGTELRDGRDIPFSCRVHEKVFLNMGKADIDEKEDTAVAAPLEDKNSDVEGGEKGSGACSTARRDDRGLRGFKKERRMQKMQRRRDSTRYGSGGGHVVEDAGAILRKLYES